MRSNIHDHKHLLENAAITMGIEIYGWFSDDSEEWYADIGPKDVIEWNPLENNSQAFEILANQWLSINVSNLPHAVYVTAFDFINSSHEVLFDTRKIPNNEDAESAYRFAIVRTAADIGMKIKEHKDCTECL